MEKGLKCGKLRKRIGKNETKWKKNYRLICDVLTCLDHMRSLPSIQQHVQHSPKITRFNNSKNVCMWGWQSRSRGRGSNAQICTLLQATGTPGIRVRLYSSILEIKNLGKLPESWVPDMRCSKIEENYHKIGQLSFFPPCFPRCEPRLQTRTQSCHLLARFRWPSSHGWSLGLRVKLRRNPNCQLLNRFHGKMGMPPLMLILVSIPPCNWR